ncbi:ABC transporter ATP-binding protein [Ornithinimicrobium faecis]|uniref:ABC transporter ATP-binding protein n=1 Tax=Ornithinimicrobium faecis TaxID=2934158 RepID=UPI0021176159|nr:ABC transporter ATP-binding protein [Ornithinimicrobium sp. HY1793]
MPTPAIEVRDLSFRYPGADHDTLHDLNLTIEQGDFVAVVGGNGSGKTTLCKTFNGLVPHFWNGDFYGQVRVDGQDTWESTVGELSTQVGYVYQDFQNQLVRPTVRDEISFGPINFGLADHAERSREAMELLGISELSDRFVWQLSGGQAHLTALASVLALRPRTIVVDEPAAELDPARARAVYEQLARLNTEQGITIVTIEHHPEFIAEFARSVVLVAGGAPVWHLPVREAMTRSSDLAAHGIPAPSVVRAATLLGIPETPLTVTEAAAAIRRHRVLDTSAGPAATPTERTVLPKITPTERTVLPKVTPTERVVARLDRVTHGYRSVSGRLNPVLRDLSLELHEGERVALVGSNGAGKTTLLKLLTGLIVPRSGEVEIEGHNTRDHSAVRMADRVAYLYQHPQEMFLQDSLRKDVGMFPIGRKLPGAAETVEQVLAQVRLSEHAEADGRSLSGGQQRRGSLAIGLAMRPHLLLLDEPTSSLDISSRDDMIATLAALSGSLRCAVVASHDMQLVASWATRVIVLDQGQVLADLSPRDLFSQPDIVARARLVPPQITQLGTALGLRPAPLDVEEFVARCTPHDAPSQTQPPADRTAADLADARHTPAVVSG